MYFLPLIQFQGQIMSNSINIDTFNRKILFDLSISIDIKHD